MKPFRALTAIEQLAAHLRGEIQAGALGETLPGVHRLAKELGVSPKSVVAAVAQLEHEGLLRGQGPRRRCRIMPPGTRAATGLRVVILLYEAGDRLLPYIHDLDHLLREAGHVVTFARKTMLELGRDVRRVAGFVERTEADAWVVLGGPGEVLEWFATRPVAAFALFGRRSGIDIAGTGPDKQAALRKVVRRLLALGHRRIVLLVRRERRLPRPGGKERAFFNELEVHGTELGSYHLPDWEESIEGFHACLRNLLRFTPPTAFIVDEAPFFIAALQFCSRHGIRVPEDVSLVCCDDDPGFAWCQPAITHIRWDPRPMVRRIVNWAAKVSRGIDDRRQSETPAEFVEGGTIGPAVEEK